MQPSVQLLLAANEFNTEYFHVGDQNTLYFPNNVGYLFPKLRYVYNERSNLRYVEKKNFENMEHVVLISLAVNLIESIPADAFDHLTGVEVIHIHTNKLKTLEADTFSTNQKLKHVYGYKNELETLPRGLFRKNTNLVGIHLNVNKLHSIDTRLDETRAYARINFRDNACINKAYPDDLSVLEMIAEIRRNC